MAIRISGEPMQVAMKLSHMLDGKKLKVGIYAMTGKALYETTTDDGEIQRVDDMRYFLEIDRTVTRNFLGKTLLSVAIYSDDKGFVSAGNQDVEIMWVNKPVIRNLK